MWHVFIYVKMLPNLPKPVFIHPNNQQHALRVFASACLNSGQLSLQAALTTDSGSSSSSFLSPLCNIMFMK